MTNWLHNGPAASLAGLTLGTVIQEALRSAVDSFVMLGSLGERLVGGPDTVGPSVILILMITSLLGGVVAGLVAALLSRGRWTAILTGVLLAAPSVAMAAIVLDGGALAAIHAVPPVSGAALGAWLALGPERTVRAPDTPDRKPATSAD